MRSYLLLVLALSSTAEARRPVLPSRPSAQASSVRRGDPSSFRLVFEEQRKGYTYRRYNLVQPSSHWRKGGALIDQQIEVLIPQGAPKNAPVFFQLGGESDAGVKSLETLYKAHGKPANVIYAVAEHRGYGQSLSRERDQTLPSYVSRREAIEDDHQAIKHLKTIFSGPYMAAGWSYSGSLAIDLAAKHPRDVRAVLASSAPIDWRLQFNGYDRAISDMLGKRAYEQYRNKVQALKPEKMFDRTWNEREFLLHFPVGLRTFGWAQKIVLPFKLMVRTLPNPLLLPALHFIDKKMGGRVQELAIGKTPLSYEDAAGGHWNWRTFRYQQLTEMGMFMAPARPDSVVFRDFDDYFDEGTKLFGRKEWPRRTHLGEKWSNRLQKDIAELPKKGVPIIYVSGAKDVFAAVGLQPPAGRATNEGKWLSYKAPYGHYFRVPNGMHDPDVANPELHGKLAQRVLGLMLDYAKRPEAK